MISKKTIEEIRDRNDIVDVVGSYVQLKRGGHAYKALCPFHKEKTPSFTVNPQRQIYHCFGCGAGGDVFGFLMNHEGVDFITAAEILAKRAGMTVEFSDTVDKDRKDKDILYAIHEAFAQTFHRGLLESDMAAHAREYLKERNFDEQMITDFKIGYAPQRWEKLLAWAKKKRFTMDHLLQAGLVGKGDRPGKHDDVYGRFRDRLMFPIHDEVGRTIGFSGRVLDETLKTGKYVNSPETALFHKSRVMYALEKARKAILDSRTVIVCEGQFDVIRCHHSGFPSAVAPQGTALTEQHARIMKRYADEALLVFDADKAGQDASLRSAEVCLDAGLSVRIAQLPEGSDPDSLLQEKGPDAFRTLLDEAKSVVSFQIAVFRSREDLSSEVGLMRTSQAVLKTVQHAKTAVQRDRLMKQAAEELGLDPGALRNDLRKHTAPIRRPKEAAPVPPRRKKNYPIEELGLAEKLAWHPEVAPLVRSYLPLDLITDPDIRSIIEIMLNRTDDAEIDLVAELSHDDPELQRLAVQLQMTEKMAFDQEFDPERSVQDLILFIRRKALEKERVHLEEELKNADGDKFSELEAEQKQLTLWIKTMRQGWETALPVLEL